MGMDARIMKPNPLFPLLAAFALAAQPEVRAATEVCGTLALAAEWTAKDSPYLVTGDIFIPGNSRLRIGPGVVVRFAKPRPCPSDAPARAHAAPHGSKSRASADAHHGGGGHAVHAAPETPPAPAVQGLPKEDWADSAYTGIRAEGTFYAVGSPEKPILFEPDDPRPGAVGWDGIRLSGHQAGAAEIAFSVFRGANRAVAADRAGFYIHHSLFEGNNTGVFAGLRGDVSIVNCAFIRNLSAGIVIRKAGPRIANNLFAENRSYGIWGDGRPAIRTWNNAFWANRDEACYKCPYAVLAPARVNANKDSCDAFGNLSADPVFMDSPSFEAARQADVRGKTPAHLVKDPDLARIEAEARAKEAGSGKGKGKRKEFRPQGQGPYRLSEYSRLIDAGHPGRDFRDRDGSPNDIGLHGGPMTRMATDPF